MTTPTDPTFACYECKLQVWRNDGCHSNLGPDGCPMLRYFGTTPVGNAADRLRAALKIVRWSQRDLAAVLEYDERTVRRWAAGAYQPPEDVLAWLELLAAFHAAHGPP